MRPCAHSFRRAGVGTRLRGFPLSCIRKPAAGNHLGTRRYQRTGLAMALPVFKCLAAKVRTPEAAHTQALSKEKSVANVYWPALIKSAAFSAIAIVGALVWPVI
jgi:hypothetical protein